jgi:hypothetical protein
MANNLQGTVADAPLVPRTDVDTYATHGAKYGKGGHRSVADLGERDAISLERREFGQTVYVLSEQKTYVLAPLTQGLADNGNWQVVTTDAGAKVWAPGAQKANSLVIHEGILYLVKQDIANGQAAPAGNTQYYLLLTPDVNKAYVDAANLALQAQIAAEKYRLDTLVTGAPEALNTLKEIADQLAADQLGAAGILLTQQQHAQQLAALNNGNFAKLSVPNNFTGKQTITYADNTYADGLVIRNERSSTNALSGIKVTGADGLNGGLLQYIPPTFGYPPLDNTVLFGSYGRTRLGFVANSSAIDGVAQDLYFQTIATNSPAIYVKADAGDKVGIGTVVPSERLEVAGNVKASQFIGDGSQLTGLPKPDVDKAYVDAADQVLQTQLAAKADLVGGKVPTAQLPLTAAQLAAVTGANTPSASNVFVTNKALNSRIGNGLFANITSGKRFTPSTTDTPYQLDFYGYESIVLDGAGQYNIFPGNYSEDEYGIGISRGFVNFIIRANGKNTGPAVVNLTSLRSLRNGFLQEIIGGRVNGKTTLTLQPGQWIYLFPIETKTQETINGEPYTFLDFEAKIGWYGESTNDRAYVDAADQVLQTQLNATASRYADIVSASRKRTYYDTAAAALSAAVANDVVNFYMPVVGTDINLLAGVSTNTHGVSITSNSSSSDIFTFRGGRQVVIGNNTVLKAAVDNGNYGGWMLGSYSNNALDLDVYIYDVHLDMREVAATGFQFFAPGNIYYRGNVYGNKAYIGQFTPPTDTTLRFFGEGRMSQHNGTMLWIRSLLARVEWRGDNYASGTACHELDSGTLVLREGTLYSTDRPAEGEVLIKSANTGANTLILDNYTVLGTPGKTVIQADKVVLRGNTVVIGEIVCNTLDDQRPQISGGSGGGTSSPAILYATTGQNTDGAMTQKAASDALATKVDLVNGKIVATQLPTATSTALGAVKVIGSSGMRLAADGTLSISSVNYKSASGNRAEEDGQLVNGQPRYAISNGTYVESRYDYYINTVAMTTGDVIAVKAIFRGIYIRTTNGAGIIDNRTIEGTASYFLPKDATVILRFIGTGFTVVQYTSNSQATTGGTSSAILYNATGQNTDGAMTQKATTDALAAKATLVSGVVPLAQLPYKAGTNIAIAADGTISSSGSGGSSPTLPPMIIDLVGYQYSPIPTTQVNTEPASSIVVGSNFVWDSAYATGKSVQLEICCAATPGRTLAASLYTLEGVNVVNSGISGFSDAVGLARSGAFTLVHGTTYQVRIAVGSSGTGYLYSARLIIK